MGKEVTPQDLAKAIFRKADRKLDEKLKKDSKQ